MKRGTLIYIALGAYLVWYFMRKKKTGTSAPSVEVAASTARQMVADVVDQTKFLPDTTTDADRYAKDKSQCL
jgi:hypothetical protein